MTFCGSLHSAELDEWREAVLLSFSNQAQTLVSSQAAMKSVGYSGKLSTKAQVAGHAAVLPALAW